MSLYRFPIGVLIVLFASAAHADPQVVLSMNFDKPSTSQTAGFWQHFGVGTAGLATGYQGTQSLRVDIPQPLGASMDAISIPLPLNKLRGAKVLIQAMVKSDNVAVPPEAYNGIKLMLTTDSPEGKAYPAADHLWGTFDWTPEGFTATVPDDATDAQLVLGLQDTTGTVWFDNVKVTVLAQAWPDSPAATGPLYTGHPGIPRLRGTMVSPDVTPEDLRVLGQEWHANLIRYQLFYIAPGGKMDGWTDMPTYNAWLAAKLNYLDTLLPYCKKYGLRVVVDLHTPPGGNIELQTSWPMFQDKAYEDRFLAIWTMIATRYKDNPTVWGYDLANEPIEGDVAPGVMDWHTLATKAAEIVRGIDKRHAIIVEAGPGGEFSNLRYFKPLPVSGVVYSIHMYDPGQITMQGVGGYYPIGATYPGTVDGVYWDRAQMEKWLSDVIEYQRRYHVQIYVGEFSAVRWAPDDSAYRWIKDASSIFEEHGWDWSYHAFREWQGWSTEIGSDENVTTPSPTPTDREMLLRSLFAQNVKP